MRIIAGTARGRAIETPGGWGTRPTQDRVREALFSILQMRIEGACVLDLFAGSGALGLEALSRGAAQAVFVDNSAECVRLVAKNADKLGFSERCVILRDDYRRALQRMPEGQPAFDIVFLDPPYRLGAVPAALELLFGRGLMRAGAVAACEHDANTMIEDDPGGLYAVRDRRRYGSTGYTFVAALK